MKKFVSRRKGFTLVELLIVIVVIGILSAMMMLSSSEAVSSAKATAIVSDLRNLKTAALAYFADNADDYITGEFGFNGDYNLKGKKDTQGNDLLDNVFTYLNGKDFPNKKSYKIVYKNSLYYAECYLGNGQSGNGQLLTGTELASVKKKLIGRAKSVGLYSVDAKKIYSEATGNDLNYVLMLIQ